MIDKDQVRKAAENVVRLWESSDECPPDALLVAEAYLDEHPADDDEPVTEAWLQNAGFERLFDSSFDWQHPIIPFMKVRACEIYQKLFLGCSAVGWHVVSEAATRGQVRLLCRALGIELKETK